MLQEIGRMFCQVVKNNEWEWLDYFITGKIFYFQMFFITFELDVSQFSQNGNIEGWQQQECVL